MAFFDDRSAQQTGQVQPEETREPAGRAPEPEGRGPEGDRVTPLVMDSIRPAFDLSPASSNTGLDNNGNEESRQPERKEVGLRLPGTGICSGLDWLDFSLDVKWDTETTDGEQGTKAKLQRCKQSAKMGEDAFACLSIGVHNVRVQARGSGWGITLKEFILEAFGLTVSISFREYESEDSYNVFVHVGSVACQVLSLDQIWERVEFLVRSLGGSIIPGRTAISRIDPRVDVAGVAPQWAKDAWEADRVVCRSGRKQEHENFGYLETFRIGKEISLTVYDKGRELMARGDQTKIDLARMQFGGVLPEQFSRFEFRVRAKTLRTMGVKTFEDLKQKLSGVGEYLSRDWFRVVVAKDKANPQRSIVDPLWEQIAAEFGKIGPGPAVKIERVHTTGRNEAALIRQALGCLMKAFGHKCRDAVGFAQEVAERIHVEVFRIGSEAIELELAKMRASVMEVGGSVGVMGPVFEVCHAVQELLNKRNGVDREEARRERIDARTYYSDEDRETFDPAQWETEQWQGPELLF